jgi:putative aldouronate transport system substrate-binding protein
MPIVTMGEVYKFGNAGYLADVKNLIQQYGSPLLKYVAIDEYNTMTNNKGYEAATIKGKVVAMPQVLDAYNGGMTFIFRKDILDQLGLNMPKSITDLDKTYAAFKAKYPSKYCIYIKSWPTELPQFWEAFGVSPQPTASYKVNGKYTFGSIQPGAKAGLAKLREWYQKGYINPSYETDYDPHQGIINGKYLSIYEGVWGSGYLYQLAAKTAPSATFAPMGYITGTNGKRGDILQYNYFQWPTMISASSKNKEAIIMEANAVAESMFRNDADLRKKYGNSYPITKLQQASNPQEVAANGTQYAKYKYAYNEIGPGFFNTETRSVGLSNTFTRADNTVNVSSKIYDKFIANNKNFSKTMEILTGREQTVVMGQMKVSQPYSLRALEASTAVYKILGAEVASKHMILSPVNLASINSWQNKYRDTLNLLTMTTYNGIIRGTMAIDDFDKYVQEFKSKGGDEVLKEINQKYK